MTANDRHRELLRRHIAKLEQLAASTLYPDRAEAFRSEIVHAQCQLAQVPK